MSAEPPELLDAFKAAALSVTKLYKTSAAAQAKARADGYQDCLDDLFAFLDKENIGLANGEGQRIRKWAAERLEGRDASCQGVESDDEVEKSDAISSPEIHPSVSAQPVLLVRSDIQMRESAQPAPAVSTAAVTAIQPAGPKMDGPAEIVVPSQDTFTFQSQHPYPQDSYLNLANLDLSDSRSHEPSSRTTTTTPSIRRTDRRNGIRTGSRTTLGRGAGQKRKVNLAEIFDLGSLGHGKDMFGGGKRSKHI